MSLSWNQCQQWQCDSQWIDHQWNEEEWHSSQHQIRQESGLLWIRKEGELKRKSLVWEKKSNYSVVDIEPPINIGNLCELNSRGVFEWILWIAIRREEKVDFEGLIFMKSFHRTRSFVNLKWLWAYKSLWIMLVWERNMSDVEDVPVGAPHYLQWILGFQKEFSLQNNIKN
jgi:hypothetical protein